jgi:hypothetical protein
LVTVYVPLPPEPDDEETEEDLISLDLFSDVSLEGVTSGADTTTWDPIRIEKEAAREEQDGVLDTNLGGDGQPAGVTSGTDKSLETDVKSSERRYRNPGQ